MSSISEITRPSATNINELPQHLLGESILPLLLQDEDPSSLHTLSLVCKSWRTAMQRDETYISRMGEDYRRENPRVALRHILGTSAKEEYLRSFRKTLIERMKRAYVRSDLNTTDFEAKTLFKAILTNPHVLGSTLISSDIAAGILTLTIILAMIPADFNMRNMRMSKKMVLLNNICASLIVTPKVMSILTGKHEELDPNTSYLSYWGTGYAYHSFFHVEGDTLLSKSYRVAKGSLSSLGVLTKAVYRTMKNPVVQLGTFLYHGFFRG